MGQLGDFRSFDVDDPTNDAGPVTTNEDLIDPNDGVAPNKVRTGRDNRGTLPNPNEPGPTTDPDGFDGFEGLLRPVFDGVNVGMWIDGFATSVVQAGGFAEVDMATSFAAGDNYRVAASTVLEPLMALNRTTDVPTTGTNTPALQEFLTVGQGAVTGQLSVWRRIHIEQDRMERAEGDFAIGSIVAGGSQNGGTATVPTDIDAEADEYAGGLLETSGVPPLVIIGNTAGPNSVFTVTGTLPPQVAVIVYQDDYAPNQQGFATTRVDTEDDTGLYNFLQAEKEREPNRFADAYMQPEHDELNQFDSFIPAQTHVEASEQEMNDLVGAHRGAAAFETDLFWVTYVSTAFDGPDAEDCDPVEATTVGLTTGANTISLVFLESTRDIIAAGSGQPHVVDYFTGVARVTVHEVGHQFFFLGDLPNANEHRNNPDNTMDTEPFTVAAGDYYFASEEVATLRMRVVSP